MADLLKDLLAHSAWADAEHWRALEACRGALEDPAIRVRLHHIHEAERAFLALARHEPLRLTPLEDLPSVAPPVSDVRACHEAMLAWLEAATPVQLDEELTLPFRSDRPIVATVRELLAQAATHSHYHRGQNAVRLRELGGEPPTTDLLIWYHKGRPAPAW